MKKIIDERLGQTIAALEATRATRTDVIARMAKAISARLARGGKLLLCGNGGSAADAQHVAAEFVGRFGRERRALPAVALTTNASILTAIGNDYGFNRVFSRQVEALARRGDVLIAISTRGNAANALAAVKAAKKLGCLTLGFTGGTGGKLKKSADLCFLAPADRTARIQEVHIAVLHVLCDLVETAIAEG